MEQPVSQSALAAACECVGRLMSLSPQPLLKVTVRIGDVSLELGWPDGGVPAAPPAAASAGMVARDGSAPAEIADPAAHPISATIVGTFYRSPEPSAEPFVRPGDSVQPGQQVAIIEAMKVMTPVEADREGWVSQILVADGESVEFGTELITIIEEGPQ